MLGYLGPTLAPYIDPTFANVGLRNANPDSTDRKGGDNHLGRCPAAGSSLFVEAIFSHVQVSLLVAGAVFDDVFCILTLMVMIHPCHVWTLIYTMRSIKAEPFEKFNENNCRTSGTASSGALPSILLDLGGFLFF